MNRIPAFLAGILTTALLVTTVVPALAAGGEVAFGKVGIRILGKQQVEVGETYAAPNGQQVPSSITYTDADGGMTNYLSVRQISELLGIGVTWNAAENSVDIMPPASSGDVSISSGTGAALNKDVAETPEYGHIIGPFEEIDPDTVPALGDTEELPVTYMKDTRVQYQYFSFPEYSIDVSPDRGQYLIYTVTNNGEKDQYATVAQKNPLSPGTRESFSSVLVKPGETIVRAFFIAKEANPLEYTLCFGIGGTIDLDKATDVTVSLEQFH